MANEIACTLSLNIAKGGASIAAAPSGQGDMSGDQFISNVQIVGTTTEAALIGDVTTIGGVMIRNLDPTNFVLVSLATPAIVGTCFAKLKANTATSGATPGSWLYLPTPQTVIYLIADTAPCNVQILAWEL